MIILFLKSSQDNLESETLVQDNGKVNYYILYLICNLYITGQQPVLHSIQYDDTLVYIVNKGVLVIY